MIVQRAGVRRVRVASANVVEADDWRQAADGTWGSAGRSYFDAEKEQADGRRKVRLRGDARLSPVRPHRAARDPAARLVDRRPTASPAAKTASLRRARRRRTASACSALTSRVSAPAAAHSPAASDIDL